MMTGLEEQYIIKNNKKLYFGYTTGSCAAAAAKAAGLYLLSGTAPTVVQLMTPKGISLTLEVLYPHSDGTKASCTIRKDSGDDPDITNKACITAMVSLQGTQGEIAIHGGQGVGRVTKPGLEQPVGEAAINNVPREMIRKNLMQLINQFHYSGGFQVVISVENGEELAKKTFNPKLGIIGGVSILGTSGIVEPMSEQALLATIELEIKMKAAAGKKVLIVSPGNYGSDYTKQTYPMCQEDIIKCSNFIGETIDYAIQYNQRGILFISHIGKFVKLAGGIMNTHSKNADCRMELMASAALSAGAELQICRKILSSTTTEDALVTLHESEQRNETMKVLADKIDYYLEQRSEQKIDTAAIVFSNIDGELFRTKKASELLERAGGTGE
ncbi:MAG: cobalt-precorrin-5B (C(1))-methyltransferase CbiD [Lachnospiraceae bacterium]